MKRECGDCTLCCKLLPVVSLDKKANEKCQFQKFHKGCSVYRTRKMPMECGMWSCKWILGQDTDDMPRPDRCHYVIDHMLDTIVIQDHDSGTSVPLEVVVIWCDPKYPKAYREPHLFKYLERRAKENKAAMVRFNSYDSIIIFPPLLNTSGEWCEVESQSSERDKVTEAIENAVRQSYQQANPPSTIFKLPTTR